MKLLFALLLLILLPRECEAVPLSLASPEDPRYTITAYCGCEICCGEWALNRPDGIVRGSCGIELKEGVSVAAPLPCGTVLNIEGIGERVVHDSTADWIVDRYGGRIIDIYFEDHEDALAFGKHTRNVTVVSRGGSK